MGVFSQSPQPSSRLRRLLPADTGTDYQIKMYKDMAKNQIGFERGTAITDHATVVQCIRSPILASRDNVLVLFLKNRLYVTGAQLRRADLLAKGLKNEVKDRKLFALCHGRSARDFFDQVLQPVEGLVIIVAVVLHEIVDL